MKAIYGLALPVIVAILLATTGPVRAAATETDARIETSAHNSNVFPIEGCQSPLPTLNHRESSPAATNNLNFGP